MILMKIIKIVCNSPDCLLLSALWISFKVIMDMVCTHVSRRA